MRVAAFSWRYADLAYGYAISDIGRRRARGGRGVGEPCEHGLQCGRNHKLPNYLRAGPPLPTSHDHLISKGFHTTFTFSRVQT